MKKYFPQKMLRFLSSTIRLTEAVPNKFRVDTYEKTCELDSICTWRLSCLTPPMLATRCHSFHCSSSTPLNKVFRLE